MEQLNDGHELGVQQECIKTYDEAQNSRAIIIKESFVFSVFSGFTLLPPLHCIKANIRH
jgi:hypothetical protein